MMTDSMREMLDLIREAKVVNGVHNPNADKYRTGLEEKMDAIPEYAYLRSYLTSDFKNIDELYATMGAIKTEDELEKKIIRTPEKQKSTFRRLWKQMPTHA